MSYGRIQITRNDIAAIARNAARGMQRLRDESRRKALSGQIQATIPGNAPTIAVAESSLPPLTPGGPARLRWETLGQLPWELDSLSVVADASEAAANRWTMRELLTRRLHRELRNRMIATGVDGREANRVARLCDVYVAEVSLATP